MKTINTKDLSGAALDYAVAMAEKLDIVIIPERKNNYLHIEFRSQDTGWDFRDYSPSTNEKQCIKIIDKMESLILKFDISTTKFVASLDYPNGFFFGESMFEAAMKCFVNSKIGNVVDIPDELVV